jgi:class 3 adenylate cyclase
VEDASTRLKTPTLLLRRPAHPLSPPRADDPLLALLPGATRVDLPGTDLSPLGGEVDALIGEIGRFVTGEHRPPAPDRELVAVLYTDLVSSTARASALGDAHWKRVLDRHDEISRSCIGRRGGTVVKTMGDGIIATLPSATSALRAAQELRTGLHAEGLDVRAAIHVGDIDRRGDDISGINVVIAARLLDLANGGEIILSSTALAATGESLSVEARGDHTSKVSAAPGASTPSGTHNCRSALDLRAPNARTEQHQTGAACRALSASLKERGRVKRLLCSRVFGCGEIGGRRRGCGGAPAKAAGSRWSARSRRRGRTTLTPAPGGACSTSRTTR